MTRDTDFLANAGTESRPTDRHIQRRSVPDICDSVLSDNLAAIDAVRQATPQIDQLIQAVVTQMRQGGRVFYIGAGSSGRYGVIDAVECPPTFGVSDEVIGLIAGGDGALRVAVEGAEDNPELAWQEITYNYEPRPYDVVVGIAASGRTPYTLGRCAIARRRVPWRSRFVAHRACEVEGRDTANR